MAEVLPLSESELGLLGALLRHKIRFMVVGLSAAALQGAPVVTEYVDLWFEELDGARLMKALTEVGAAYIPPFGYNPPMLAGTGSEPFDIALRMNGLDDFATEWKRAKNFKIGALSLKVLPLERILASKQAANRPKDQRIIPTLQNTLRTLQTKARRARKRPAQKDKSSRKNRV